MKKITLSLCILLFFTPIVPSEEGESEGEEIVSITEERHDILRYGIDSQVIEVLEKLEEEQNSTLAEEAEEIFIQTFNIKVKTAILSYFTEIDYLDASEAVLDYLATYEKDELPAEIIADSIRYVSKSPEGTKKKALDLFLELCRYDDEIVARAAVEALGLCEEPRCTDFLFELYEDDDLNDTLRGVVLTSLGKIGSKKAVPMLMDILEDEDEERSLRWNACKALGTIGDKKSLSSLRKALQSDDTYLRSYATAALASFEGNDIEQLLVEALRDSFWRVRKSAAETLGDRKASGAVPILIFKAEKDPEQNVRLAALTALGAIGTAEAMEFIVSIFSEKTTLPPLRMKSAEIIIEQDLDGSLDTIEEVIAESWDDANQSFLNTIGKYLSLQTNKDLEPLFVKMLDHPKIPMRLYAIRGIAANSFKNLRPRLEDLTLEGNPEIVRKEALAALEEM